MQERCKYYNTQYKAATTTTTKTELYFCVQVLLRAIIYVDNTEKLFQQVQLENFLNFFVFFFSCFCFISHQKPLPKQQLSVLYFILQAQGNTSCIKFVSRLVDAFNIKNDDNIRAHDNLKFLQFQ